MLFCLFAIALFAVIATLLQTTREITPKRPRASLRLDFGDVVGAVQGHLAGVSNAVVVLARAKSPATVQRIIRPFDGAGALRLAQNQFQLIGFEGLPRHLW